MQFVIEIEDGMTQNIKVKAHSTTTATVLIKAASWDEAQDLVRRGQELARQDMKNYKPEPEPEPERRPKRTRPHFIPCPVSTEELEKTIADFTQDEAGKRFLHSMQTAKEFVLNVNAAGFSLFEVKYLYALACIDPWNAIDAVYQISYKRGYMRAKKAKRA